MESTSYWVWPWLIYSNNYPISKWPPHYFIFWSYHCLPLVSKAYFCSIGLSILIGFRKAFFCSVWRYSFSLLKGRLIKRLISWGPIPLIGGMCYTLYLIHFPLISQVLKKTSSQLTLNPEHLMTNVYLCFAVLLPLILIAGGAIYLLLERPFMNPAMIRKLLSLKRKT